MKSLALVVLLALQLAAQVKDNGIGTWIFDASKSTYESSPAPKQSKRQWVAQGDSVKFLHDGISADNKPFHTEFVAKYDKKAVPFVGGTRYDAVALELKDANTVEQTFTLKGVVTVRATRTISADGQTMTIIARGNHPDGKPFRNTLIYRRQK